MSHSLIPPIDLLEMKRDGLSDSPAGNLLHVPMPLDREFPMGARVYTSDNCKECRRDPYVFPTPMFSDGRYAVPGAVTFVEVQHDLSAIGGAESCESSVEARLFGGVDGVEHAPKLVIKRQNWGHSRDTPSFMGLDMGKCPSSSDIFCFSLL